MPDAACYLFAYGSLMNDANLAKRFGISIEELPERTRVHLRGYRRIFDKPGRTHFYLNLAEDPTALVEGVVFPVNTDQLVHLAKFEPGYELADVTAHLHIHSSTLPLPLPIRAFIWHPLTKIRQSYIDLCTAHLTPEEREEWIADSIIPDGVEIEDDT